MNEGAAEQRNEQAVAARRVEAEDAAPRTAARRRDSQTVMPHSSRKMTTKKVAVCQVHAIQEVEDPSHTLPRAKPLAM